MHVIRQVTKYLPMNQFLHDKKELFKSLKGNKQAY